MDRKPSFAWSLKRWIGFVLGGQKDGYEEGFVGIVNLVANEVEEEEQVEIAILAAIVCWVQLQLSCVFWYF